jgi:hypothetical protein
MSKQRSDQSESLVDAITYGVLLAAFAEYGITPEAFRRAAAAVARTNAFAPAQPRPDGQGEQGPFWTARQFNEPVPEWAERVARELAR